MVKTTQGMLLKLPKDIDLTTCDGVIQFTSFVLMNFTLFINMLAMYVGVSQTEACAYSRQELSLSLSSSLSPLPVVSHGAAVRLTIAQQSVIWLCNISVPMLFQVSSASVPLYAAPLLLLR